ncbi:MAG TPA: Crp/Fnr family transcriptional regulator [Xanthobacteraceae bacterium]|nr:Crp/Fnr family transcriptional regulator [Xanthobacteraceae bacterium]
MTAAVMAGPRNRFFLALPPEDRQELLRVSHRVQLPSGHVIYRTGEEIEDVYFIDSGLVCLLKRMEDGRSVEIAAVGAEGLVGVLSLVGSGPSVADYVVQVPITAHRISLTVLQHEMSAHVAIRSLIARFLSLLTSQFAQVSACNRLHALEQRCCSWLLIARDNVFTDRFQLTHEFMASLLGVQRPSVSMTANGLQKRGLIRYTHGHVTILDRAALELTACECYRVRRRQIDEAFGSCGPIS